MASEASNISKIAMTHNIIPYYTEVTALLF